MLFLQNAGAKVLKISELRCVGSGYFCNFAANLTIYMKKRLGLVLIVVGVLLLAGLKLAHLSFVNVLLLVPLLVIIIGVALHVWAQKKESAY